MKPAHPFGLLAFAMAPLPALAAAPAPEPLAAANLLQLLFGLIVVLMAIGVTAFLFKRLGRLPQGPGMLRVVAGLNLGARERAVLVQVGDKQLLLGVAPGRVQMLYVLEQPVDAPRAVLPGGSFAERLAQLMKAGKP